MNRLYSLTYRGLNLGTRVPEILTGWVFPVILFDVPDWQRHKPKTLFTVPPVSVWNKCHNGMDLFCIKRHVPVLRFIFPFFTNFHKNTFWPSPEYDSCTRQTTRLVCLSENRFSKWSLFFSSRTPPPFPYVCDCVSTLSFYERGRHVIPLNSVDS